MGGMHAHSDITELKKIAGAAVGSFCPPELNPWMWMSYWKLGLCPDFCLCQGSMASKTGKSLPARQTSDNFLINDLTVSQSLPTLSLLPRLHVETCEQPVMSP
eukprot:1158697-Pelagomonas_calceolata.AAC.2